MELDQAEVLFTKALNDAHAFIAQVQPLEALLVFGLFVTGYAMGSLLDRLIDRLPQRDWKSRMVDYLAPLMHSLITVAFIGIAVALLKDHEINSPLLALGLKIAIAWFAIRLVMLLMSSRRSAGWVIALVIIPLTLLHLFDLWDPLQKALTDWEFTFGTLKLNAFIVVRSAAALTLLFWFAGFITRTTDRRLKRIRSMRASNRALIMKIFQIVLYFIVLLIALPMLGINFAALTVVGGAIGVGIGFGLQKIASNFISGIILLFERSIRIDDVVELADGTMGFIRHTGARYTLLETSEGKEVLIPNEDFITQRVINWTYSNRRARAQIAVTVAYDSDLKKVKQLMLDAANAHTKIAKDPPANCYIDAFGENGIQLLLYCWVNDVTDGRLEPRSDIMYAIWEAFKANGIKVPSPQREVRIVNQGTIETA